MIDFPGEYQRKIPRLIHLSVKGAYAIGSQDPELLHHTTGLVPETDILRIQPTASLKIHKLHLIILDALHLRVDHTVALSAPRIVYWKVCMH